MTRRNQSLVSYINRQDKESTNQIVTSTKSDNLPGFIPVTKTVTIKKASSSPESFVQIPSSQNRFDLLGEDKKDEEDDKDEELDMWEGTNIDKDDDSTATPVLVDLLHPPRSSILASALVIPSNTDYKDNQM